MTAHHSLRVRWRALAPLALFLAALTLLWALFADGLARRSLQEAATQVLGTQVDVGWLRIRERDAAVEIGDLAVADPFDPTRNIVALDRIRLVVDPAPLLERKIVVTELVLEGIDLFVTRDEPATPVEGGLAARTGSMVDHWRGILNEPFLGISAVDSVRSLVLEPSQLTSVARAEALVGRADSLGSWSQSELAGLELEGLAEDATSLAGRVAAADPSRLGISGTRALVGDARSMVVRLSAAESALAQFDSTARVGLDSLAAGMAGVERARLADYRRAESMLGLPELDVPSVGGALFGEVSLSYIERAVYWGELARHYMPPGLERSMHPGPKRMRASGTDVRFPRENGVPAFHLVHGVAGEAVADTAGVRNRLLVTNVSSQPALVPEPAVVSFLRRDAEGKTLDLEAVMDHRGGSASDSLEVSLTGFALAEFELPGLSITAQPGPGSARLSASMEGDRFTASWTLEAPEVSWRVDSTGREGTPAMMMLSRVLAGLEGLRIEAEVAGTLARVTDFTVRSNLDEAMGEQIAAIAGDALAEGRARAHAEVDRVSGPYVESARSRLAAGRTDLLRTLQEWQDRLLKARARLDEEIRRKTGGLGGLVGMY